MKKRVFFGQNDIRFLYFRYRDSNYYSLSIIAGTIVVCIILIVSVIIPQFNNYFSIRREVEVLRSKLKNANENINLINNLDKSILNSQFQIATQALPITKEFEGIINAIAESTVRAGVSVNDFSFRLGGQAPNPDGKKASTDNLLPIDVQIEILGSVDGTKKFLKELSEKIPLSEVTSVEGDSKLTRISMQFYYKQSPKVVFNGDEAIVPMQDAKVQLIRKLSSWQTANLPNISFPSASSSGVPLF